jgi:hypothetical protein
MGKKFQAKRGEAMEEGDLTRRKNSREGAELARRATTVANGKSDGARIVFWRRWATVGALGAALLSGVFSAFEARAQDAAASEAGWKNAENGSNVESGTNAANDGETSAVGAAFESDVAPESVGFVGPRTTSYSLEFELPKGDGQFWAMYDVAPYSERFPNLASPQNAIVDWIMFEAGDDFWRCEPFSAFSASRDRLYVYHNESVQRYVANVVDRFLDPTRRNVSFSIRVVAVKTPDWRSRFASRLTPLRPVVVGNGVDPQGWLVEKAELEKVYAEMKKRADFVLLNPARSATPNAETLGVASVAPKRELVRDVRLDSSAPAGYVSDVAAIDEGFRFEATPLLSTNGETFETLVRYRATVVEKTAKFGMRVPTSTAPRQRLEVERPSIVSCDVRVKLAFPRTKGAILDLGAVPMILPKGAEASGIVESVSRFVAPQTAFYNVVVFLEEAND